MKKVFKIVSISLAALLLASCEAKASMVSESSFKNNILPKMEVNRLGDDFKDRNYSLKRVLRNISGLLYSVQEYQVDTTSYSTMIDMPQRGAEMSLTFSLIPLGEITVDEEGAYVEDGLKATSSYSIVLKDPDPTDEDNVFQFTYVKTTIVETYETKGGQKTKKSTTETEEESCGIDHNFNIKTTDEEKAFINAFFAQDEALSIYNLLKAEYNGYLDEIVESLNNANEKKEILSSSSNYIYRYLNDEGYHEYQISKTDFTVDRVGYRPDLNEKVATTISLFGFKQPVLEE